MDRFRRHIADAGHPMDSIGGDLHHLTGSNRCAVRQDWHGGIIAAVEIVLFNPLKTPMVADMR